MKTVTKDIKDARRHVGGEGVAAMKTAAHRNARRSVRAALAVARYDAEAEVPVETPVLTGWDVS